MVPCSIWIPPAASGPVLTVSRPMRTGLDCAIAGNGKDAVTAAPAAPARNPRRSTLPAISLLLFSRGSIALGKTEHVLREVVEHHLLRDRRDLVEPDLAPEPLDVKFLRVAVAPVGLQRDVAGLEAGLGRHQLGGVRLGPARPPAVEEPGGLQAHQLRRLELGPGHRERVRDRLVLADRAIEHDPLLRVLHAALERGAADPDRLDAGEDALGVERVQEMVEAAADLADDVRRRNLQPVDEDLVGVDGRAAELLDLEHGYLR